MLTSRGREKKTVIITFRCTEEHRAILRNLAEKYKTSIADVLAQLIDVAAELEKTKGPAEEAE